MKRLFVHILVFSLAATGVWAEGIETTGNSGKTVTAKTTENTLQPEQLASANNAQAKISLKTYSMNSLLFVETNSEHPVSIVKENGKLEREVSPTGVLMAFPMSRGTYTVKTGDLSEQVVVR